MEGSAAVEDLITAPESWESADLDASIRRLMLKDSNFSTSASSSGSNNQSELGSSAQASSMSRSDSGVSEDAINSVDQFLREAIQNPRERLSVLRIEQDIENFIKDPTRQQMEFQQLPTSYLRLAAHRVAQYYYLQSMVLMDNSIPDISGSKIIVCKTSERRIPAIRLADIPLNLPTDGSSAVKVAIKQRPQKGSESANSSNSQPLRTNSSKSVEERKEEYNRARARIFNSDSSSGGVNGKPEGESRTQYSFQHGSLGVPKLEEKLIQGVACDWNKDRGPIDSSVGSSRSARSGAEKEPVARFKTNNRVAIFKDREIERRDPDYDRSYERYTQRFDPGFGFNGHPYIIQPMYAPALNYNTEFPQLGAVHQMPVSANQQPRPLAQHLPGPWVTLSAPAGIGYGRPETMGTAYSSNHFGGLSNSSLYLHSAQYSCQHPGVPFIHPHEQVHHPFLQSHPHQPDASFGLARPQ